MKVIKLNLYVEKNVLKKNLVMELCNKWEVYTETESEEDSIAAWCFSILYD